MENKTENRNASFPYPPLLPNYPSIRLLRFYSLDELTCRSGLPKFHLVTFPFDASPDYDVLSYTGGCPFPEDNDENRFKEDEDGESFERLRDTDWDSENNLICCNERPFYVRRNLHDALTHLGMIETSNVDWIWVDTLCINENDLEERSVQTDLVGILVATSRMVFCWLGIEDAYTRRAVRWMKSCETRVLDLHRNSPELCQLSSSARNHAIITSWKRSSPFMEPPSREDLAALEAFCERRYFKSLWAMLHLALAEKLTFLCGDVDLYWPQLLYSLPYVPAGTEHPYLMNLHGRSDLCAGGDALRMLLNVSNPCWDGATVFQHAVDKGFIGFEWQMPFFILMMLVIYTIDFSVDDPLDRIYVLFGMAEQWSKKRLNNLGPLTPWYSLPVHMVYNAMAQALLVTIPGMPVLSIVEDRSMRRTQDLPSWVPDFNARGRAPFCPALYPIFKAGLEPEETKTKAGFVSWTEFQVRGGVLIDVVAAYTLPFAPRTRRFSRRLLKTILELIQPLPEKYRVGRQDRLEALWRALVWDTDFYLSSGESDCSRAQDVTGEFFPHWLASALPVPNESNENDDDYDMLLKLFKTVIGESALGRQYLSKQPLSQMMSPRQSIDVDGPFHKMCSEQSDRFFVHCKCAGRKVIRTWEHLLGLSLPSVEVGDQIWILKGARVPVVLRPVQGRDRYHFMGDAYVHGYTFGEVFSENRTFRPLTLV